MADTYWIADRKTGSSVATQLVDFSEKTFHENSTTDGILSGSYLTLGRPNVTSKATDEISNLLTLSILLVDNKTVITKQYDIAPRAAINNETKEVEVVLGTGADPDEEETPEDIPLELPNVKPATNGGEGGFDASVDNWGDEVDIVIPA